MTWLEEWAGAAASSGGGYDRQGDRVIEGLAALTRFVSFPARARRQPRAANLALAAERGGGDFLFWLIGGGEAAAAPAVGSTMSYRVGSSNRPLDRLVVCPSTACVLSRFSGWNFRAEVSVFIPSRRCPPNLAVGGAALPVNSCSIDGEAIVCDGKGLAVFQFIRNYRRGNAATLCAFDLIEIDGQDLRQQPIEERKQVLKGLLSKSHPGIAYNRHYDVEGSIVFYHACKLGCEGIVSKRFGSQYRSGRSADWIKVKNPASPAVKRKAEEEWS